MILKGFWGGWGVLVPNIHALPYSKQLRIPYHIKTGCLFFSCKIMILQVFLLLKTLTVTFMPFLVANTYVFVSFIIMIYSF